jgi:hypothetical protein
MGDQVQCVPVTRIWLWLARNGKGEGNPAFGSARKVPLEDGLGAKCRGEEAEACFETKSKADGQWLTLCSIKPRRSKTLDISHVPEGL